MLYEESDDFGKYLEEFRIGNIYKHSLEKTIAEKIITYFAK